MDVAASLAAMRAEELACAASGSDTERKAAIETLIAEVHLTDQGPYPYS